MMRARLVALVLAFGCSSQAPRPTPSPTEPPAPAPAPSPSAGSAAGCVAPEQGQAMTREQCTCLGGRVNLSRGGEQEHCAPGEAELGPVRFGLEGGWCCKAP